MWVYCAEGLPAPYPTCRWRGSRTCGYTADVPARAERPVASTSESGRKQVEQGSFPARNPKVVHSQLAEGEAVLLHLDSGAYHELNPIGAVIWDLLDGSRSKAQIVDEVRERVDDAPDDLEEIVADYLAQLRERDLIG